MRVHIVNHEGLDFQRVGNATRCYRVSNPGYMGTVANLHQVTLVYTWSLSTANEKFPASSIGQSEVCKPLFA